MRRSLITTPPVQIFSIAVTEDPGSDRLWEAVGTRLLGQGVEQAFPPGQNSHKVTWVDLG